VICWDFQVVKILVSELRRKSKAAKVRVLFVEKRRERPHGDMQWHPQPVVR
jgi:hypothetical protein